ncbi:MULTISPECIES: oligopeptide ABC transporter permease [Brevibacillus]|uniref:ABC transporter permease n=1 Tax=Brevibacillus laterosporus TaxID=1465 RepID=A0AAP8U3A5_BRELA|nr:MULTISPECIES: oligopeptide ABC transporter permease [Brevibacillus]ATO48513.1 peptide ABC transporter permease [Brevibacillus laterosporus DSM 25]AYB41327.1 ABC transporter permease [Brevibacillus laterosporus]MBG9772111.1 peptide ABC transporter permease [Brevibacillus laterosporus]MBG9786364.1 peptide ABC transporter permease [Brevibacillus laterosporus]MBG9798308.1 peptide ABC transporter permease [Brevibacillus laterosporus]
MVAFALRRFFTMIPILILISIAVFTLAKLMPGDALSGKIDPNNANPEYIAKMRESLGFNDPIPVQYGRWVGGFLQGNLGDSFNHKMPVTQLIGERLPNTIFLMSMSLIFTYLGALVMGMIAARRRFTWIDNIIVTLNYVGYAIPSFFAAIVCIYVFAILLGWVPASGSIGVDVDQGTLSYYLSKIGHTILPATVLGLFNTAAYTQFLRNDIIEGSGKDYVRTAMAKGTGETAIYNKHILRNSLIPMVTFLGLDIGNLLGGAVIVETIFTYPGLGQLFINSVNNRDYSVVMSITMLLTFMALLGNLIADWLYSVVDPRIRLK